MRVGGWVSGRRKSRYTGDGGGRSALAGWLPARWLRPEREGDGASRGGGREVSLCVVRVSVCLMCDCVQRVLSRALCVIVSVPSESASASECEYKCNVCRGVCVTLCCFALSFAPFLSLVYN